VDKADASSLPPADLDEPAVLVEALLSNLACSYDVTTLKDSYHFLSELQLNFSTLWTKLVFFLGFSISYHLSIVVLLF